MTEPPSTEQMNLEVDMPEGPGLTRLEFNQALDLYLSTRTMHLQAYEQMDNQQRDFMQQLKRAFRRLRNKQL